MATITIYTSPTCGYCHQAKQLLESEAVEYTEIDVIENPDARDAIVQQTGHMTLPIIMHGEQLIGGYDDLVALHRAQPIRELFHI